MYDSALSNFAVEFNLRRYIQGSQESEETEGHQHLRLSFLRDRGMML
jgi:hypothetical protein